jgi:hypothetical protein
MARAKFNASTSQAYAGSVGNDKTILQVTAPAATPLAVPRIIVTGDGTSATAAKMRVDVVRGATGGTGSNVTVPETNSNNPASTTGPTAKENFSVEPAGGTVIHSEPLAPYGSFPLTLGEVLLAPGETLGIRVNAGAAVNIAVNMPQLEV